MEYTLDIIKTLNISDPSYIYTPSLSHVKVPVYADNVFRQISFTRVLISCLKSDTMISKSALDGVVKTIYLRDFFVDDDGNYDDVVMRSQELAEVSRELLELFIEKEDTEQTDSSSFHNRLVLGIITQVIMNYYQILEKHASYRTGYQNGNSG